MHRFLYRSPGGPGALQAAHNEKYGGKTGKGDQNTLVLWPMPPKQARSGTIWPVTSLSPSPGLWKLDSASGLHQ
ncbi:hypothetical protein GGTG_12018 [Gaeumannomyces tritici R3-111a-1]|uniref:Uncharacterized protein n=1 Tax=Gaeumannomyces tritici (strain R3-111a-1) TaxID=644352 RepID=J3PET9_GAET3|nr:hypothetical protein GGTG_12018 [Gaeumannomyces tritici R3-111a-1]EJT70997.1 hypothetical protein GGTG_12018 [Gaeumannomyces tritici R3-111a-1]